MSSRLVIVPHRLAKRPPSILGTNVHIKYGNGRSVVSQYPQGLTAQQYLGIFNDVGYGWARTNCSNATDAVDAAPFFDVWRAGGVEPFVVIDQDMDYFAGYTSNYNTAKSLGTAIGAALAGHCLYFETSNERDYQCRIDYKKSDGTYRFAGPYTRTDGTNVDGSRVSDYDPTAMEGFMGWNTGMTDGLKVNIPNVMNGFATGAGYGYVFATLLHYGSATIGGPQVRTPCPQKIWGSHWYMNMGDPTKSKQQDGTIVDVLGLYNSLVPGAKGFITEWGFKMDESTQAATIPGWCHTWNSNRFKYNILGAMIYAQFPNPASESGDTQAVNWGMQWSDLTKRAGYTAMKNYIALPY